MNRTKSREFSGAPGRLTERVGLFHTSKLQLLSLRKSVQYWSMHTFELAIIALQASQGRFSLRAAGVVLFLNPVPSYTRPPGATCTVSMDLSC